jgi:CubicO group peptidase (beta-lactamase class C family)
VDLPAAVEVTHGDAGGAHRIGVQGTIVSQRIEFACHNERWQKIRQVLRIQRRHPWIAALRWIGIVIPEPANQRRRQHVPLGVLDMRRQREVRARHRRDEHLTFDARAARVTRKPADDCRVEVASPPHYSCLAGAGAFLSTPADLVRLGTAVIRPGFLKADTIALFHTPLRLESGAATTYALGWTVDNVQLAGAPVRISSHRGSPVGGTISLMTFPDLGLVIAVTSNVTHTNGVAPLGMKIAEAFATTARGRVSERQ